MQEAEQDVIEDDTASPRKRRSMLEGSDSDSDSDGSVDEDEPYGIWPRRLLHVSTMTSFQWRLVMSMVRLVARSTMPSPTPGADIN
jgi:hypothetical protein